MTKERVDCQRCAHFRRAPYEARWEGCYHPDHLKVKQKEGYLDEQQLPGNHRAINRDGDCVDYEARPVERSVWKWLLGA
jgi:hypothetical protein